MKRSLHPLLPVLCAMLLCSVSPAHADQPFRNHRYDAFRVLPPDDADILFIGNSITNMHEWWEAFGNDDVCNRGTSGGYSYEVLANLGYLVQGTPRKVFLMIGTNDIGDSQPDASTISNIEEILTRIHILSPTTELYCQSILPCASTDKRPASSIMGVNSAVKEWCETTGYATYLDVWSQLRAGSTNYLKGSYSLDGLHLKASGYKAWCNYIAPQVGSDCTYPAGQADNVGTLGGSYGMRESAFAQSKVNAGDILIIGDEAIHGGEWHELLQSDKVKSRGTGWSFPGPTISQVTAEVKNILAGRSDNEEPAAIVLSVGAADCNAGTAVSTSVSAYKKLISTVRSYAPGARLLLVSVLPNGTYTKNTTYVEPFNAQLKALAEATDSCDYADVYTAITADQESYMEGNYLYGLGYARMAEVLAPQLGLTAVPMAEAKNLYERSEQRCELLDALVLAVSRRADDTLDETQCAALDTVITAARQMLADKEALAGDYSSMNVQIRRLLAEMTYVDPDGYLLDMTTGTFTAGSGSFRSKWETNADDPHITFGCGPNNMNSSDNHINIFSGTAGSSLYTLTCSTGFLIDHYEFDATATASGISIVTAAGTTSLTSGKKKHFTFTDVNSTSATFTLQGSNKQVSLTDFRVFLKADDGSGNDNEPEECTEVFVTKGTPNYRIPAIACTRQGTLIAVGDYRYGGTDIGYGAVELRRRISYDNGKTWGDILEFTHGNKDMNTHPNYHAAYGDPCIVADRESDRVMVMSCSGNTGFPNGTRTLHQGIMRFYSTDEGESWSDPVNLEDMFYSMFDTSTRGPIRSMFIGSGKIHQSRYVKVGDYYRLYCSALVKDVNSTNCNYVFYSDDFGDTWHVLGDIDTPAIPSGADEPKAEELPDGSVICSSRINGGRYYNIFTFTDAERAEGSWGSCAASNASNSGVIAESNSCNGEVMVVPAVRKVDGERFFVVLQSVPFGPARSNVGIYWKVLDEATDFDTPAHFARQWDGKHQASTMGSAYSTMCMQADGRIAFFYEESTYGADYTLIYKPYTLEQLTDSLFAVDVTTTRWDFLTRFIDAKVSPFYAGSKRIVGAPDPDRRAEVDAAMEAFKAEPSDESYADVFATMAATQLTLDTVNTWYALRNVARSGYYMKSVGSKASASATLISSSVAQHFRFLPVEGQEGVYTVQCAQNMRGMAATGADNKQLSFISDAASWGTYTVTSDIYGRSLLTCTNPTGSSTALYLNYACDKVIPGDEADAARWYIEATDYVPTAITPVEADAAEAPIYDLMGRRVLQPATGIYIRNGKKYLAGDTE